MKVPVKFREIKSTFAPEFKAMQMVSDGGYEKGYTDGYETGKAEGYEEGSAFYNDFWDAYQNNGARTDYSNFGFGNSHWNDATFKPKYNMRITSAVNMFNASSIVDANGCLNKAGVTMDFSKCKDFYQMFCFSKIEVAPIPIDVSSATRVTNMFQYASALKTLKLTGLGEGRTPSLEACTALVNLELEGSIYGTFHMYKTTNLTVESAKNVLLALNDYSGTDNAFAYSLTLHGKVWAALDALGETSPHGNNWVDYATDKGWNT